MLKHIGELIGGLLVGAGAIYGFKRYKGAAAPAVAPVVKAAPVIVNKPPATTVIDDVNVALTSFAGSDSTGGTGGAPSNYQPTGQNTTATSSGDPTGAALDAAVANL